ncbi:sugar ABC transporter ATP-binding protein [Clostridium intestinale]|uniref:sugar ABC transporter ATP-binding protein n=1 Tax=Clostridium intestinale TaxID=36845 RepID=UPI0028F0A723|nr:sugar ABC transporter ATP-binding protein [Clostridium intestinale]
MAENYILELKGITKIFPGVKALDNVQFQLKKGEIHALMGENGAGKSTFIKVITGVHEPEEGEIYLKGKKVVFKDPKDAQKESIAAIYQHGTVYGHLTVTENIFIGHEKLYKSGMINWRQMHKDAKELLERLGCDINPKSIMGNLTVAEQQIIEIAKAISTGAEIIIMDEPTAALSKRECEELYRITEQLRDEGRSIIFISHRFEDMYRLASRVTVFRDSQYIGTWGINDISNEVLISKMVGRKIDEIYPKQKIEFGDEIFKVEGFSKTGYYKDITFSLKKGEILAITGLVGAGRTEVCHGIFGIEKIDKGEVYLEGKSVKIKSPLDAMNAGIGYLPEDRQKQGLILDWGIGDNITLATLDKFSNKTILNRKRERTKAKELAEKVKTKALSVFDKVSSLSGGNQQKVVVAKILNSDLKVIILDEPTKGVDVGAKAQIYEIMSELASKGYGVIMISSEMPEVLGMADRIVVMKEGRVSNIFDNVEEVTQEQILEAAMNI